MPNALTWIMLVCAALGTAITAWTSSGVGGMHYTDSRELQRAERFKDVLSRHVEAMQPQLVGAAEAVRRRPVSPSAGQPAPSAASSGASCSRPRISLFFIFGGLQPDRAGPRRRRGLR